MLLTQTQAQQEWETTHAVRQMRFKQPTQILFRLPCALLTFRRKYVCFFLENLGGKIIIPKEKLQ